MNQFPLAKNIAGRNQSLPDCLASDKHLNMKSTKKLSRMVYASLTCAFLWAANPSSAVTPVVAFSSFGPGNTFDHGAAWGISGANIPWAGYYAHAEWFVPTISGNLSSFTLATYLFSRPGVSSFFIAEDSGSSTPGTILESFPDRTITPDGLMTVNSSSTPMLQAGVKYWLGQQPTDPSTYNGWFFNNQKYLPGFAQDRGPGQWEFLPSHLPSGVFQVSVTPVPEPSLFGFLIPGVWILLRRHKDASQIAQIA